MAEKNAGKAGIVLGGAALVASAIALAKQRVALAAPGGEVTLDEATMTLIIALAQTSAETEDLVNRILASLGGSEVKLQVQGFPPNTETGVATRVGIAALATPYQLPDIVVPDDMNLQIKGWPLNGGMILVGFSRSGCTNINQVWPLLANEAIGYRIKNAQEIYISGTAVGDWCAITVEQRR